ncbi:MAG: serine/threonine-protein kinase [Myxococcota bacterium]|nr:serine/threonine-protein kinase [Myxococcota bacterium]
MTDPLLNSTIDGRYKLTGVLGQGGMGIVYRAEDLRLSSRPCAVKLIKSQSYDATEEQRFERELSIISILRSNHVVHVLDSGRLPDKRRYIVMELLEGAPLSQLLETDGQIELKRALQIAKGILAGLSEAHEAQVIHRDLKPQNIFITRSRTGDEITKVLDFGIAKDTRSGEREELTSASVIIGTPKYMAPEQFLKESTDASTDLYAVGLLLYQMLAGHPPFLPDDESVPNTLKTMPPEFKVGWLHINAAPRRLPIPDSVWTVLERLLAKKREDRFASAELVIQALNQIIQHFQEESGPRDQDPRLHPSSEQRALSLQPAHAVEESVALDPANSRLRGRKKRGDRGLSIGTLVALFVLTISLSLLAFSMLRRGRIPATSVDSSAVKQCLHKVKSEPVGASIYDADGTHIAQTPFEFSHPCSEQYEVELRLPKYHRERVTLSADRLELQLKLRRCRGTCPAEP